MRDQFFYDGKFFVVGTGGFEFGSCESFWQGSEHLREWNLRRGDDFGDFGGGEKGVVKAIPAVFKKNMAGDFAAEMSADFLHSFFNKTVAYAGHDRDRAKFFYFIYDNLRCFDIENDFRFWDFFYKIFD